MDRRQTLILYFLSTSNNFKINVKNSSIVSSTGIRTRILMITSLIPLPVVASARSYENNFSLKYYTKTVLKQYNIHKRKSGWINFKKKLNNFVLNGLAHNLIESLKNFRNEIDFLKKNTKISNKKFNEKKMLQLRNILFLAILLKEKNKI